MLRARPALELFLDWQSRNNRREANIYSQPAVDKRVSKCGQVAQVVERSPEKAGVGGSTPSLATIILKGFAPVLCSALARRSPVSQFTNCSAPPEALETCRP
jgi:hypothetical protein